MTHQFDENTGNDAWLDALLKQEAAELASSTDPAFTRLVMQSIGSRSHFERGQVAQIALAGGAAGVTAICITLQLPELLTALETSLEALAPQQFLAASAPFILLAGFSWFAYRMGAGGFSEHSGA